MTTLSKTVALATLAALGAVLAGALAPARAAEPPKTDARPAYILLVYPIAPGQERNGYAAKSEADLVTEYRAWANRLRESGALVDAAKLAHAGRLVSSAGSTDGRAPAGDAAVSGYFVIRAADEAEAARVAATCPHVTYGGTLAVRPLEAGTR